MKLTEALKHINEVAAGDTGVADALPPQYGQNKIAPNAGQNQQRNKIAPNVNQAQQAQTQQPQQTQQTQQPQQQNGEVTQSKNAQTLQNVANAVKGAAAATPVIASVGTRNNGEVIKTPSGKQVAKVNYNTIKSASGETEQKFKAGQADKYISIGKQTKDDPKTKLPAGATVMTAKDNQRTNKISLNTAIKMLQNIASGQPAETGVAQNEMEPVIGNEIQDLSVVSDAQEQQAVQQSDNLPAIQGQSTTDIAEYKQQITDLISKKNELMLPAPSSDTVQRIQDSGQIYMNLLNYYGKWMSYIDPKQLPESIQAEMERTLEGGNKEVQDAAKDGENSGKGKKDIQEWFKKHGGWTGILGNVAEVIGRFVGGMGAGSEMKK